MEHFDAIKDYYGKVLQTKEDLKTTACCAGDSIPGYLKPIVAKVHETVQSRFYGCGVPIPEAIEGCQVVDLGCGTGRDCFVMSKLVGEGGRVIGIDMTRAQLDTAREYQDYHKEVYGLSQSNVDFRQGFIEDLAGCDIASESADLVVSNCVINLSPRKDKVFSEIHRILKSGGELYFSDVFVDRRLSEPLTKDPVLLGECLGGAMYLEDFRRLMQKVGFADVRVVSKSEIQMTNPDVKKKVGPARFYSYTFRAFKLDLEDRCEDYGQLARYLGTIDHAERGFRLDDHHYFETGKPFPVCSNTAAMLAKSRFKGHFEVIGDTKTHYGLFDCAPGAPIAASDGGCC